MRLMLVYFVLEYVCYFDNFEEIQFVPEYEEKLVYTSLLGSTSKSGRKCPVCLGKFAHVHLHVTGEHLLRFIEPYTACWECQLNFCHKNTLYLHNEKEHANEPKSREFDSSLHMPLYTSYI